MSKFKKAMSNFITVLFLFSLPVGLVALEALMIINRSPNLLIN